MSTRSANGKIMGTVTLLILALEPQVVHCAAARAVCHRAWSQDEYWGCEDESWVSRDRQAVLESFGKLNS